MYDNVPNRCDGHVVLQRLPVVTIVKRYVQSELRRGIQEALRLRVLFDGVDVRAFRYTGHHILPALATVMSAVDIRLIIGDPMTIHGSISRIQVEMPRLELRNFAPG